MGRLKNASASPKCKLCGEELGTSYTVNMEVFCGRAGWNLSFQPRITVCKKCSDELLKYIEKWFSSRNKTHEYEKFYIEKNT